MASVTRTNDEKRMADDDDDVKPAGGKGKGEKPAPLVYASKPETRTSSFFTLYKRGQGYWTRVGSVAGAVLIGAFTAYNVYILVPPNLPDRISRPTSLKIAGTITAVFAVAYSLLAWYLLNKPSNVDFLVATDSEMKKVNWTSRTELIGSTKIVIIFMFLVAIFLFGVDQIFGWLMYWCHVLQVSPMG